MKPAYLLGGGAVGVFAGTALLSLRGLACELIVAGLVVIAAALVTAYTNGRSA